MRRVLALLIALGVIITVNGCGGGGGSSGGGTSGTTNVTIHLGQTRTASSTGEGVIRSSSQIPSDVTTVRFIISGPGMETIVRIVTVEGRETITVTFEILNGPSRLFVAEAFNGTTDNANNMRYRGEATADLEGKPLSLSIVMVSTDSVPPVFGGLSSISSITDTSMLLSWNPATDNVTPQGMIQYLIYRATTSGGQDFNSPTYTPPAGATSSTATGLAPETTYYFVVRAKDERGNTENNSIQLSATTLPTPRAAIRVTKSCINALAPGQPIRISAIVENTGNEPLDNITCVDNPPTALSQIPVLLEPGASVEVTGSYVAEESPSTDILTCSGMGVRSATMVKHSSSATCRINTSPALTVVKTCTAAWIYEYYEYTVRVDITATVTNTGNETIEGITCTDTPAVTFAVQPGTLAPGQSATITGSYFPEEYLNSYSDTIECSGIGAISGTSVKAGAGATCQLRIP